MSATRYPTRAPSTWSTPPAASAFYAEAIDKRYGEIAPTGADDLALVGREPIGVVGAVVPWNYPLIVTSLEARAGARDGQLGRAQAGGAVTAERASSGRAGERGGTARRGAQRRARIRRGGGRAARPPPDVDKIAFTGSVAVGRLFLRYAGESNGKAVSLELGGKSPQIVLADARDLEAAAQAIGWGIFYNAGQTCHAGSRLIVAREVRDEIVERITAFAARDGAGRSVRPGDAARVARQRRAPAQRDGPHRPRPPDGARVLYGGQPSEPVAGGAYLGPTLVEADDPALAIVQEEVFGPVLAIQTADDPDHALALANSTRYGLAAALWTSDLTTAGRISRRLRAGTVWVNSFDRSSMATPFGGMKESGHGRDRSLHALDAYAQLKTTWIHLG